MLSRTVIESCCLKLPNYLTEKYKKDMPPFPLFFWLNITIEKKKKTDNLL